MSTDFLFATSLNVDSVSLTRGMVVRLDVTGAVRAQADAEDNLAGLYGIVTTNSAGVGGRVAMSGQAAAQPVLLEDGLTPVAGDVLYVSDTVAGRATNVAPAIAASIAVVVDASAYNRTSMVLAKVKVTASATPFGVAVLSWEASTNNFVPSDNIDARTGYGVVGRIGNTTYGPGTTVRVAFTTDGGAPIDGQTFWLASQQDDSNTGRGKGTATIPSTAMPPLVYPQIFRQNIVPIGTVVDASAYGTDGTAIVELAASPTEPTGNTPAADVTHAGARITSLSNANYFSVNANKTEYKMGAGQTLIVLFSYESLAPLTNLDDVMSYSDPAGANGWILRGGGYFAWTSGDGDGAIGFPQNGLNCLVISVNALATSMIACSNGGAVHTTPIANPIPVPAANWILRIGGGYPGNTGWAPGGVVAVAMLNRTVTSPEAQAIGVANTAQTDIDPENNRYVLPDSVLDDAQLMWTWNAADWDGVSPTVNTTAGPAGTADTLTQQGAPELSEITDVWKRDTAALFLDTELPKYDSLAYPRGEQAARIAFQVATAFEVFQCVMGQEADDFDNNDNAGIAVMINGVAKLAIPLGVQPPCDAVTYYYGLQGVDLTGLVAPYNIEFVTSDKVARGGTFNSGACMSAVMLPSTAVFETAATARRLLVFGDGQTLAGHDSQLIAIAPETGAVITRLRADYPGRITGLAPTSLSVSGVLTWSADDTPGSYAKFAASLLAEGSPATTEVFVMLGVVDYYFHLLDPVPYGVALGQFLDALHAAAPAATIFMAPPCQNNLYAVPSPSGGGHTLQEYVNKANDLSAGRPWLTIGDVTGPTPVTYDGVTGMPPVIGATGQVALKDNIKTFIGY